MPRLSGESRYNPANDPMEKADLAADQAGRVQAMTAALEGWMRSVNRSLHGMDY